jgi:hypothetical protein
VDRNVLLTFQQQRKKDYKFIQYKGFNAHYSAIMFDPKIFIDKYWKDMESDLSE